MKKPPALRYLWAEHRPALVAAVLAVVVIVFFTVRLALFTLYWSAPEHRDQAVEHWMTARYISYSHRLDIEILHDAIGPASTERRRATLDAIAAARGEPVEAIIARIDAAIEAATEAANDAPLVRE